MLGTADHDGADDAGTVEEELAVDVRGRVVEDDGLEAGAVAELADGGGGEAEQLGDVPAQLPGYVCASPAMLAPATRPWSMAVGQMACTTRSSERKSCVSAQSPAA